MSKIAYKQVRRPGQVHMEWMGSGTWQQTRIERAIHDMMMLEPLALTQKAFVRLGARRLDGTVQG